MQVNLYEISFKVRKGGEHSFRYLFKNSKQKRLNINVELYKAEFYKFSNLEFYDLYFQRLGYMPEMIK